MKRRNVEGSTGKLRRAAKRSKISDGYSVFFNLKYLLIWAFVITLDFVADFRFELLYPFWVFVSNISETFKFKGISYLFSYIFITLTIDMICFYLIPVHWLFFASSTYVWLQFTWYSERGLTLVSIIIWVFFISIEAFVRLRELKSLPLQFEICRPFAAHGIGYPIFTLGIGCKSYVHYQLRLHKKRIVAKENQFYYSLLEKAVTPVTTQQLPALNGVSSSASSNPVTSNSLVVSTCSTTCSTTVSSDYSSVPSSPPTNSLNNYLSPTTVSTFLSSFTTQVGVDFSPSASSSSSSSSSSSPSKIQSISVQSNGTSTATTKSSTTPAVSSVSSSMSVSSTASSVITTIAATAAPVSTTSGTISSRNNSLSNNYSNSNSNSHSSVSSGTQPQQQQLNHNLSINRSYSNNLRRSLFKTIFFPLLPHFVLNLRVDLSLVRWFNSTINSICSLTSKVLNSTFSKVSSVFRLRSSRAGNNRAISPKNNCGPENGSTIDGSKHHPQKNVVSAKVHSNGSLSNSDQYQSNGNSVQLISDNLNHCDGISIHTDSPESEFSSSNSNHHQLPSKSQLNSQANQIHRGKSLDSRNSKLNSGNEIQKSNYKVSTSLSNDSTKSSLSSGSGGSNQSDTNNNITNSTSLTTATSTNSVNKLATGLSSSSSSSSSTMTKTQSGCRKGKKNSLDDAASLLEMVKSKDDTIWKLDSENQKLKANLQTIRHCETDLRAQLTSAETECKQLKASISSCQSDNQHLQKKLQTFISSKQQDKQAIQRLEKQLETERQKSKASTELQAACEKKTRMAEESAARANAIAEAVRNVCSDSCRMRQREIEYEMINLKKELHAKDEQLRLKELLLDGYKDLKDKGNMLMSALSAMHDKNSQLEESLNVEKIIKLELYNTIEEAKRQINKHKMYSMELDKEHRELKAKFASLLNSQNSLSNVMTSNSGGLDLNGFNTPSSSSLTLNNIDLINRCFSSCSPNNAASPTSLSSGTPPLLNGANVGAQSLDCSTIPRSLCNVSPVLSSNISVNSPFLMNYSSLDHCLNVPWPSSIKHSQSSISPSQSDLISSSSVLMQSQQQQQQPSSSNYSNSINGNYISHNSNNNNNNNSCNNNNGDKSNKHPSSNH